MEYSRNGRTFTVHNPYSGGDPYKGQLHAHTDQSPDVTQPNNSPTQVATAYKNAGYNFIALTDHDNLTTPPGVSGITFLGSCIEEFYNPYSSHIIALNTSLNSSNETLQDVVDDHKNAGALVTLCHPNLNNLGASSAELLTLERFNFIEVHNTFSDADSTDNAEDKWDTLLTYGKKVYGTSVDDCHDVADASYFDDGWVMAFADDDSSASLLESLEQGNFYSSIGASITSIVVTDLDIAIVVPSSSKIEFIGKRGRVLQTDNSVTSATYTIQGDEMYVRVRVTKASDSTRAWSQPIFLDYKDNQELTGQIAVGQLNGVYDNALTNSNFNVWQRGTSFTATGKYTADRWRLSHDATSVSVTQQSIPNEYGQYAIRLTLTTKGGSFTDASLMQALETQDSYSLAGKSVVFSALVRRNSTFNAGNFRMNIYQGTGTDEPTISTGRKTTTKDIAFSELWTSKWTRVWMRAYIERDKTQVGVLLRFQSSSVPNGSYFEVKQAQLHIGSYPKLYSPHSYSDELRRCQRYYYFIGGGANVRTVPSSVSTATVLRIFQPLPTPQRLSAGPSVAGTRGTDWVLRKSTDSTSTAGTVDTSASSNQVDIGLLRFDTGSYTVGEMYSWMSITSDGKLVWDAEL